MAKKSEKPKAKTLEEYNQSLAATAEIKSESPTLKKELKPIFKPIDNKMEDTTEQPLQEQPKALKPIIKPIKRETPKPTTTEVSSGTSSKLREAASHLFAYVSGPQLQTAYQITEFMKAVYPEVELLVQHPTYDAKSQSKFTLKLGGESVIIPNDGYLSTKH